MMHGTMNIK